MHKDDCIWTEPNRCNCGWLQDIAKNPCEAVREIDRLRAELARKAEGYTRLAEVHEGAMKLWESQEREAEMKAYEMAAELKGLREEVERLRHDIERHIAMASELATENEWLRAELAACREDAEKWRAYAARKRAVIDAGMGKIILRDAARKGEGE